MEPVLTTISTVVHRTHMGNWLESPASFPLGHAVAIWYLYDPDTGTGEIKEVYLWMRGVGPRRVTERLKRLAGPAVLEGLQKIVTADAWARRAVVDPRFQKDGQDA